MELIHDFQTSVRKAFDEIDPNWENYKGFVVCGTHNPFVLDSELLLNTIKHARENNIPFLGICFGHQMAAVEYARNVLGNTDASSEELGPWNADFVVVKLPRLKVGLHDGESYWNNYEVLPDFEKIWIKPKNFITVQYHPEYQSSKEKPHPILVEFLKMCKEYEKKMAV